MNHFNKSRREMSALCTNRPILNLQWPFEDGEVLRLAEEYLRLYHKFQHLIKLARINLDLLFTSAGMENVPGVEEELDKVQELILALMNEREIYDLQIQLRGKDTKECDDLPKLVTIGNSTSQSDKNSRERTSSLDHQFATISSTFTEQEMLNAFRLLGKSFSRAFPSPLPQSFTTPTDTSQANADNFHEYDDVDLPSQQLEKEERRVKDELNWDAYPKECYHDVANLPVHFENIRQEVESKLTTREKHEQQNINQKKKSSSHTLSTQLTAGDDSDRNPQNRVSGEKIKPLDRQFATISSTFTQQEILSAFRLMGKSFSKVFPSPLPSPFTTSTDTSPVNDGVLQEYDGVNLPSQHLKREERRVKDESHWGTNISDDDDSNLPIHFENNRQETESKLTAGKKPERRNMKRKKKCPSYTSLNQVSTEHGHGSIQALSVQNVQDENPEAYDSQPAACISSANSHQLKSSVSNKSPPGSFITHEDKQPWLCVTCGKGFKSNKSLLSHLPCRSKKEKSKKDIVCDICGLTLKNKSSLVEHMKTHQEKEGDKTHICHQCGQQFKSKPSLKQHLKNHEEKDKKEIFKCTICDKDFNTKSYFRVHMNWHSSEKTFICHFCGKSFDKNKNLSNHISKMHSNRKPEVCEVCGKSFTQKGNLNRHMAVHSGVKSCKCSMCDKTFYTKDGLNAHMRTHTKNYRHICSYCGKGFIVPSQLRVHERFHSGERPFTCSICGKGYVSAVALNCHKRCHTKNELQHDNDFSIQSGKSSDIEKPFSCLLCLRSFSSDISFSLHMLNHGEELNQCYLCDEKFGCSSNLKSHLTSVHLKERFKCSICEEEFYTRQKLHSHKMIHQDQNKLTCSYCGKTFSQFQSKTAHELTKHSSIRYTCEICGKHFISKGNMVRHRSMHTNVKPFKCQVCGYEFRSRGCLKQHWWKHSTEKRYKCEICNQGFNDKRALVNHNKKHHLENSRL